MPDPANPTRHTAGPAKQSAAAPILLRFFGDNREPAGVNGDYFTVGESPEDDIQLPASVGGTKGTKLRFSRGAEGWRVTLADEQPFYLNQSRHQGLTPLRSGDVVRLTPGGAGMQFLLRQQQDASLAKLAARHAPRLLKQESISAQPQRASGDTAAIVKRFPGDLKLPVAVRRALGAVLLVALAVAAGYVIGSLRSGTPSPAASPAEPSEAASVD